MREAAFMASHGDFARMDGPYADFFPSQPPARSTVQVAALPKGAMVEIECVAVTG